MNKRFENINLLRAFAVTAVVVYHVIELTQWKSFPFQGPLLTFRVGWIGVDLFFVISGFVITYSALALYQQDPSEFNRRYWARRLSRIVPLYVLTGALWIALFSPDFFSQPARHWVWQLLTHLTFTHSFWSETFGSIDGVNWSLALEMQFYLAVALLVRWLARTAGWRIWVYCILIAWSWRAAMYFLVGHEEPWRLFMHVAQLPGTLDEFGAGIFLAKTLHGSAGRGSRAAWISVPAAIVLGSVCMGVYWPRAGYWDLPVMVVFWHTLVAAFLLCVVAAAMHLPSFAERGPARPAYYLGDVSYGIYLWHPLAIQLCLKIPDITPPQVLVATLGLTLMAAMMSWHFLEKPLLGWGRKLPHREAPRVQSLPQRGP